MKGLVLKFAMRNNALLCRLHVMTFNKTKAAKILVRSPNFLGDHVMALGFYHSLRRHFADAELTLACPQALAELSSLFDKTVSLTREDRLFPRGVWDSGRRLRSENFDLAITLPASISSAVFLSATGAKTRVGFSESLGSLFLTSTLPWKGVKAGKHKSEHYLDLASWLGIPTTSWKPPKAKNSKTMIVAPGASKPMREWPHFQELLIELSRTYPDWNLQVVGIDPKWESFFSRHALPNVSNLTSQTSISALTELCQNSSLVIANDSGVAHLAASVAGARTLTLFGPGNPDYVKPLGDGAKVLRAGEPPCSPCESPRCRGPYGYRACLTQLSVDSVLEKVRTIVYDSTL